MLSARQENLENLPAMEMKDTDASNARELSLAEKEKLNVLIDEYLMLNEKYRISTEMNVIDRYRERMVDCEQKIFSFGNKALLSLKERMLEKRTYIFSQFSIVIAEQEDIDLLLEAILHKNVIENSDGSSMSNLIHTLGRLIYEIRADNASDPRLDMISEKLSSAIDRCSNPYVKYQILEMVSLTGSQKAKDFFEKNPLQKISARYFASVENYPRFYLERSSGLFPTKSVHAFDQEMMGLSISGWNEPYSSSFEDDEFPWDDDEHEQEEFVMDDKTLDLIKETKGIAEEIDPVSDSLRPLANLMIFNHLKNFGPDEKHLKKVTERIIRLQRMEDEFEKINLLPTIGIEVECHDDYLDQKKKLILEKLNVNIIPEMGDLIEVNPDYSYSPILQSRYLQELVHFGAIPLDQNRIPDYHLLSLHVNFGVPAEIGNAHSLRRYNDDMYIFSDLFSYAFASPQRIRERKTDESLNIQDANRSKKFEKGVGKSKGFYSWKEDQAGRLEYRANEFRNFPTYRMLIESQRIAAMLFCYAEQRTMDPDDKLKIDMADMWSMLKEDFNKIREKFHIDSINYFDYDKYHAAGLIEGTGIRDECRKLITQYSQIAATIMLSNMEELQVPIKKD